MTPPIELPMAPAGAAPGPPAGAEAAEVERPAVAGRRFRVDGMDCAACAATVERSVAALDGVRSASVSFGTATLTLDGDVADPLVVAAITRAGYRARPAHERPTGPRRPFWRRDARTLSTTVSLPILLAAVIASVAGAPQAVAEPLYVLSMLVGGWPIARAALAGLRRRRLDMNVLMATAALGAVAIGAYAEGAWVLVLFAIGTTLETLALERSRNAVDALMELAPREARVLRDGQEHVVPVEDVRVGDHVRVRPGERIAVDGVVRDGASSVDQSPVTGESVPVDVLPGDATYAGSLNVQGTLVVRATRVADDSTLSRIAALVEEAQGSRAPSERFIDRFARVYTPLVFAAALLLAVVPPLAFDGRWDTWVYRALALLIVACPCSLVISVPVAVVSAVGGAARRGVLVAGGRALEDLGRVDVVAIDKTGTLTLGLPRLETIVAADGRTEDEVLALMTAIEQPSEHPLAGAFIRAARERSLTIPPAAAFAALPGRGTQATVAGRALWAGGPRLARERLGDLPPHVAALHDAGQAALVLGEGDRVLAVFGVADTIRPEARDAVAALAHAGISRVVMLTGDSEPVARSVAEAAGVAEWRAEMLPADKLQEVEALGAEGHVVAMVGDGINDAPALAAARVGVAMGAAGSDVALQTADVALLSDRLDRLPFAVGLARRALGIMRFNVVSSLAVKGLLVLLAPFGLVTLVVAVAADMGMSLLVTLNALRLLGRQPGPEVERASGGSRAGTR